MVSKLKFSPIRNKKPASKVDEEVTVNINKSEKFSSKNISTYRPKPDREEVKENIYTSSEIKQKIQLLKNKGDLVQKITAEYKGHNNSNQDKDKEDKVTNEDIEVNESQDIEFTKSHATEQDIKPKLERKSTENKIEKEEVKKQDISSPTTPNITKSTEVKKDASPQQNKKYKSKPYKEGQDEKQHGKKEILQKAVNKKLHKGNIKTLLEHGDLDSLIKSRKQKRQQTKPVAREKIYQEVSLTENMTIGELANRMTEKSSDIIKELMKLGIMARVTDIIELETAELIVTSLGHSFKYVKEDSIESLFLTEVSKDNMNKRCPIVTIMGHVDHGKTTLLDALHSTDVSEQEHGGITQHIGAYQVTLSNQEKITFFDTPGHEAFTQMRSRGANITDIVVLVVAADDGVKAQTIEAINHIKAAEVPIIVAINKIDKPGANIEKVKQELLVHNLVSEDLGGDVIFVPISAKNKQNLDKLEEAILLLADVLEIKSSYNKEDTRGVVIEAHLSHSKGVEVTVLVQHGVLSKGDIVVSGSVWGKVKRLYNDKKRSIPFTNPGCPVIIYGFNSVPESGNAFILAKTEKDARDLVSKYQSQNEVKVNHKKSFESIISNQLNKTGILSIIIKADVHGSREAVIGSIEKITKDNLKVQIIHSGVGGITESDVSLAQASSAIILGFNVKPNQNAAVAAKSRAVEIKFYSVIYHLIEDIEQILDGMISPDKHENELGVAQVRKVFNITGVGKVCGCYVTNGKINKSNPIRMIRDDTVIHNGKVKTLKRFQENVTEVSENYECGIVIENYSDIKEGDVIESYEIIETKKAN